jgi:hypothetical protein
VVRVFHPERTFDILYETSLSAVERQIGKPLTRLVRQAFVKMARVREGMSSAKAHLALLYRYTSFWEKHRSDETCLVCLAQAPEHVLTCQHWLCGPCVILCGSPDDPWQYRLPHCPLCGTLNDNAISIRPPTAGVRIIRIGISAHKKALMAEFLKNLQFLVGLVDYPVGKHFDVVIGHDLGSLPIEQIYTQARANKFA